MIQATIKEVIKDRIVKTGEEFLEVTVDFKEGGKKVESRKYGFPLGTSADEIKERLAKAAETIQGEREQKVTQKEVDAQNAQANETIEALTGETIEQKPKAKKNK